MKDRRRASQRAERAAAVQPLSWAMQYLFRPIANFFREEDNSQKFKEINISSSLNENVEFISSSEMKCCF